MGIEPATTSATATSQRRVSSNWQCVVQLTTFVTINDVKLLGVLRAVLCACANAYVIIRVCMSVIVSVCVQMPRHVSGRLKAVAEARPARAAAPETRRLCRLLARLAQLELQPHAFYFV